MKKLTKNTKTYKLFSALQSGERLTAAQISKRFGIANPTATISDIRHAGYAVYGNQRKAGNGVVVTEYELGLPSRRVVAAGYIALKNGLVTL